MTPFVIVEQVGDVTFQVAGHSYDFLPDAMLAVVDLTVASYEEREFFVDGPDLRHPIGLGFSDGARWTDRS